MSCVAIIAASLGAGGPASAGLLDPVDDILNPSPSPSPTPTSEPEDDEEDPDLIQGVIKTITGEEDGGEPQPEQGSDPKSESKTSTSGSKEGASKRSGSTTGTSGTSGNGATAGSSATGATGATDPSDADDGSYPTLAARGTVATIERALSLAGPLAPPLLLGAIALVVLIGLARGSDRLVKLDGTRFPEQTYRL